MRLLMRLQLRLLLELGLLACLLLPPLLLLPLLLQLLLLPLLLLLLLLLPPPHPLLLPPHPLRLLLLLLLLTIIMIKRASFSHLNRREHVGIVCVMCVFALGAHTKKRIITIASNEIPHIITLCWKCILRLRPAAGTRARCAMVRCAMSTSLFTWFVADDMRGCTVWPRAAPTCLS